MSEESFIRIDDKLLVSLSGDMDDDAFLQVQAGLAKAVDGSEVRGVLLDVSGVAILDTFLARALAKTVTIVRLMGSEAVVVGVQPAVAITLVELGIDFSGLPTALDAGRGIRLLERGLGADGRPH